MAARSHTSSGRVTLAVLAMSSSLVLSWATFALSKRAPKPPCEPGAFLVTSGPLVAAGDPAAGPAVILLGPDSVAIPDLCDPTRARIKNSARRMRVEATWKPACGGLKGKASLIVKLSKPDCNVMEGTFAIPKAKVRAKLRAVRSTCGDGVVDRAGGEECDDGLGCEAAGTCDPARCVCIPPAATTTTTSTTGPTGTSTTSTATSMAPPSSNTTSSMPGSTTTTIPSCGDRVVNSPTEECDGPDDAACPGACVACRCQTCDAPTITNVSPRSGPPGTPVTITGTDLACGNQRSLTCNGVAATITSLSETALSAVVPPGVDDCLFSITTPGGTATASEPLRFDVVTTNDFALRMVPGDGSVMQGASTTFTITLEAPEGFSDLVTLGVGQLRQGLSGALSAPTITRGGTVTLTVAAAGDAPTGSGTVAVGGVAQVEGLELHRDIASTVSVNAGGKTAVIGLVRLTNGPPLQGVVLTLGGKTTTSDAGGNFQLVDVPAGEQNLTVDVRPVDPVLPIYGVTLTLAEGVTHRLEPFNICPPLPPERYTPLQSAQQPQVITDGNVPDFEFRIPPGTTITGWDGNLKTKMGVERLERDQLPMPAPPFAAAVFYQPFFGTAAGGIPSAPIGVALPNESGAAPGTKLEMWYYDAAPFVGQRGEWKLAGMGTVSPDGRQVVADPGVGIQRFCGVCGTTCIKQRQDQQQNNDDKDPKAGDPVNLAIGQMITEKTDLILPGRITAMIHRVHNPLDPLGGVAGVSYALRNWALSVESVLLDSGSTVRLILPGNSRYEFVRATTGVFRNITHVEFAGATLTSTGSGAWELRFKDGMRWLFAQLPGIPGTSVFVAQVDRNGNRLSVERDQRGAITRIVEPAGRALRFRYDAGRLAEVTDPIGRRVGYAYDASNRLAVVTDAAGGTTRYAYDAAGRVTAITDPRNITYLRNEYAPQTGNLLRQTQADGGEWKFYYDLEFQCVQRVACSGGSLICCDPTLVAPAGGSAARVSVVLGGQERFQEGPGRPLQSALVDPRTVQIVATTVVDPRGNPTRYIGNHTVIDALGQKTEVERDRRGAVTAVRDALGRTTRFEYDELGAVTKVTDAAGAETRFEYGGPFHQLVDQVDALGNKFQFGYDAAGNLTDVVGPLGHVVAFSYDSSGLPASATDALGNVSAYAYDAFGNLRSQADPLGNTTLRAYDLSSRLISRTDPTGGVTRFSYSPHNRLTEIVDALGGVTRIEYDANANPVGFTDALGRSSSSTFDAMDRPVERIDPLERHSTARYDSLGNVVELVDRRGFTTAISHDVLNRSEEMRFADGSSVKAFYSADGRISKLDDTSDGALLFEYDSLGRLARETTPRGTVSYRYDLLGRRSEIMVGNGDPAEFKYDAVSRLAEVSRSSLSVRLQYDAAGRRVREELPGGMATVQEWDAASRLTRLRFERRGNQMGGIEYEYDATGRRLAASGAFQQAVPGHPASAAAYDAANQQTQFGQAIMDFDAEGNVISIRDPDQTMRLDWDARGRLVEIQNGRESHVFKYDARGRRIERTVNGDTTRYVYDGLNPVKELSKVGDIPLLTGLTIDEIWVRGNYVLLRDVLGSVTAVVDADGRFVQEYAYDPFGTTVQRRNGENVPYRFAGREYEGMGLYYFRARYYAPRFGRFISEDPLGATSWDLNSYSYAGNSPLVRKDPLGLWYIDINITGGYGLGVTGGLLINGGGVYPYLGGGAVTPGVGGSITWSPSEPTPGWNIGLSGQGGIAGQIGYGFGQNGGGFYEVGVGWPPGASLTGYYVWGPIGSGNSGNGANQLGGRK